MNLDHDLATGLAAVVVLYAVIIGAQAGVRRWVERLVRGLDKDDD